VGSIVVTMVVGKMLAVAGKTVGKAVGEENLGLIGNST